MTTLSLTRVKTVASEATTSGSDDSGWVQWEVLATSGRFRGEEP